MATRLVLHWAGSPPTYSLNTLEKEACDKLARELSEAFVWSTTPEGGEFWSRIMDRLLEYSQGDL